jgi:hypothetical protein
MFFSFAIRVRSRRHQGSEPAAGEDQFEIGVPAELLPMPGAVECFEPDTHVCFHFRVTHDDFRHDHYRIPPHFAGHQFG